MRRGPAHLCRGAEKSQSSRLLPQMAVQQNIQLTEFSLICLTKIQKCQLNLFR